MKDSKIKKIFFTKIYDATIALESWISSNGISGYDPHDIKGVKFIRKILFAKNKIIQFLPARIVSLSIKTFPRTLRKLFFVKKTTNAKGVGLITNGYINFYQVTNNTEYKTKALKMFEWLDANVTKKWKGISWGYPFDWESRIFIPKGTPSSVVTCTIGDAYWNAYKTFGDEKYLQTCESICIFLTEELNRKIVDESKICFSYTPIDNFQVHNANLFVAEFLVRIGKEIGSEEYLDLGKKAANFALSEQYKDGSLDYWSKEQSDQLPNRNDHYHIGFEIRSLFSIGKILNEKKYILAAEKYYKYYLNNLLEEDNEFIIPKLLPESEYPIDIHSCAEAILLNTQMKSSVSSNNETLIEKLTDWIITFMQNSDGSFYYKKMKVFGFIVTDKTPHLRWGQAWMFFALSFLLKELNYIDEIGNE